MAQQRTVIVSDEVAAEIDEHEEWLREVVVPAYDRLKASPETALTPQQVHEHLLAHHAERVARSE